AAGGAWLAAPKVVRILSISVVILAVVTIVLTETSSLGLIIHQAKGRYFRDKDRPLIELWNPLSYVYATIFLPEKRPVLWAASPSFRPTGVYPTSVVRIDGDAWTPIYAYHDPAELTFLRYDGVTAAHVLRPRG